LGCSFFGPGGQQWLLCLPFLVFQARGRSPQGHKPNSGSQIHNSPPQPTKSLNRESQSHPLSLRRRPAAWRCGRGGARAAGGPATRLARRGARVAGRPADLHDASAERGSARLQGPRAALEHGEPPSRAAREQPRHRAAEQASKLQQSARKRQATGKPAGRQSQTASESATEQPATRSNSWIRYVICECVMISELNKICKN